MSLPQNLQNNILVIEERAGQDWFRFNGQIDMYPLRPPNQDLNLKERFFQRVSRAFPLEIGGGGNKPRIGL